MQYSFFLIFLLFQTAYSLFSWKSCLENPTPPYIEMKEAYVNDTIPIPGNITVALAADFSQAQHLFGGHLKLNVTIQKYLPVKQGYNKIPCFLGTGAANGIGSCVYDDICELIHTYYNETYCPPQLISNNITCACPFQISDIRLKPSVFHVQDISQSWLWAATGNFTVRLELTQVQHDHTHLVGCVELNLRTELQHPLTGPGG